MAFSSFAPDRVDGKIQRDATVQELRELGRATEKTAQALAATVKAMAEEIETLKREAGLLP